MILINLGSIALLLVIVGLVARQEYQKNAINKLSAESDLKNRDMLSLIEAATCMSHLAIISPLANHLMYLNNKAYPPIESEKRNKKIRLAYYRKKTEIMNACSDITFTPQNLMKAFTLN